MHALLRRQGCAIDRDQTGRTVQTAAARGVKESMKLFTTKPDPTNAKPWDLVQCRYTADAPRRLGAAVDRIMDAEVARD